MSSADSHPTFPSGAVVAGKLRIVRTIGSGGMGVVYEVEHELTRHRRALKVIHADVARHPSVFERFYREASAAARIGNAHVAETYDAGRLDGGEPYLLMELVDGETLDQRLLRDGPLSPGDLADLIHQACDGLQAAHDAGIVHRDLKPENLMVTLRDGVPFVKVLDFGISKFDTERTGSLGITVAGSVMGTPYYMSPEQVRGVPLVDARTDVYALGVILYECACGVRPFDAATVEALSILIHIGTPTPLAYLRPSLPKDLCAIVHRAMAVDPYDRFDGARALGEALAPLRVRTLRAPLSSAPPRTVMRLSNQPRPEPRGGPASSMTPSTDGALASTMGRRPRAGRRRAAVATGGVLLATAAITGAFAVSRRSPSQMSPERAAAAIQIASEVAATSTTLPPSVPSTLFAPSAEAVTRLAPPAPNDVWVNPALARNAPMLSTAFPPARALGVDGGSASELHATPPPAALTALAPPNTGIDRMPLRRSSAPERIAPTAPSASTRTGSVDSDGIPSRR